MIYTIERSLYNFEPWAGAVYTKQALLERGDIEAIEEFLDECSCDQLLSETQINDFLWFEVDTIADVLGFENWEKYLEAKAPKYSRKA